MGCDNSKRRKDLDRGKDKADQFSGLLFETLFGLGLMPLRLGERPASFEKYPRQLLEKLRIAGEESDDFERAYESWQSDALRKAHPAVREAGSPRLGELKRWVLGNEDFLRDRRVSRDLRTSIYGRAFMYLMVRLAPALEFKENAAQAGLFREVSTQIGSRGQEVRLLRAVVDGDFLRQHFEANVPASKEKLRSALGEDRVGDALEDSMHFILANPRWFNRIFSGAEDRQLEEGDVEEGERDAS
jgi:hypothetical protein